MKVNVRKVSHGYPKMLVVPGFFTLLACVSKSLESGRDAAVFGTDDGVCVCVCVVWRKGVLFNSCMVIGSWKEMKLQPERGTISQREMRKVVEKMWFQFVKSLL